MLLNLAVKRAILKLAFHFYRFVKSKLEGFYHINIFHAASILMAHPLFKILFVHCLCV